MNLGSPSRVSCIPSIVQLPYTCGRRLHTLPFSLPANTCADIYCWRGKSELELGPAKRASTLFKKALHKKRRVLRCKSKSLASALAVNLRGRFKLLPAARAWRKAICAERVSRRKLSSRIFALWQALKSARRRSLSCAICAANINSWVLNLANVARGEIELIKHANANLKSLMA